MFGTQKDKQRRLREGFDLRDKDEGSKNKAMENKTRSNTAALLS